MTITLKYQLLLVGVRIDGGWGFNPPVPLFILL